MNNNETEQKKKEEKISIIIIHLSATTTSTTHHGVKERYNNQSYLISTNDMTRKLNKPSTVQLMMMG